jgi:prepilin peptidase CpaA
MRALAMWQMIPIVVVLAITLFTDLRSRRIPNWLVLPFLLAGFVVLGWRWGWQGLWQSLAGAGLAVLIFGIFFLKGGMGAGDIKLCAAIGAWMGPQRLFVALILIALAGGVMALAWAAWGGFLKELFSGTGRLLLGWRKHGSEDGSELLRESPKTRKMPYVPAIVIGTLLSFLAH